MEESRLKPMPLNYDVALFNELYGKTEMLRKKLASEIDCRRFGVDYKEVLSWFDVKFIFVFSKYQDKEKPNVLLGMLINSLKCFKCRILRKAYTKQFSQQIISFDLQEHDDSQEVHYEESKDHYYNVLMGFMKDYLSDDAYCLLEISINPPPYIMGVLTREQAKNIYAIPDDVILDYFGICKCPNSIRWLDKLRKEIKHVTNFAKDYFNSKSLLN